MSNELVNKIVKRIRGSRLGYDKFHKNYFKASFNQYGVKAVEDALTAGCVEGVLVPTEIRDGKRNNFKTIYVLAEHVKTEMDYIYTVQGLGVTFANVSEHRDYMQLQQNMPFVNMVASDFNVEDDRHIIIKYMLTSKRNYTMLTRERILDDFALMERTYLPVTKLIDDCIRDNLLVPCMYKPAKRAKATQIFLLPTWLEELSNENNLNLFKVRDPHSGRVFTALYEKGMTYINEERLEMERMKCDHFYSKVSFDTARFLLDYFKEDIPAELDDLLADFAKQCGQ